VRGLINKYCQKFLPYQRVLFLSGKILPILILWAGLAKSQTYPVQASLFIPPPYSVYLSDYTTVGSTKLNLNVFLADLSRPDLDVRFRLLIEGSGIEIKTKPRFIGKRVSLISGIPTQIYGDDLQEYFDLQNLDLAGVSRSQLERTGALPEGIYRFTLEVLEFNRGVQVSNSAQSTAWLILNDPPLINLPLDNAVVAAADPQTVRFQWTPRHKGSPNSSFSTEYSLKVVEIWPESRNPNDAINTSNPIFETTTTNNYFIYGLAEPPLIPGRKYAFQVQAKAQVGIDQLDLFKNNGNSVVQSFTFGESCNPPSNLVIESSGNSYINLAWQPSATNTAFTIKFKEDSEQSNWFDNFSYLPNSRMDKLKPGTDYQVQVQAMCGTLLSEESSPIIVSTTNNQNQFACGNIDLNFDLDNKAPIDRLNVGDYIFAGDFDILLDSISRDGNKFMGTGMASFPFLNFVKAKVRFSGVQINTDYRMFDGVITTIYDPFTSMMYNLDDDLGASLEDEGAGIGDEEDSIKTEETNLIGDETANDAPTSIDSIYTNENGEIIIIINNEESTVELPDEGQELSFTDSNGNQITVDSAGNIQTVPPSTNGSSIAGNGAGEDPLEFTFGPLVVTITEEKEVSPSGNRCVFNGVEASVKLLLADPGKELNKTINLESVDFSYTKECDTGEIISAKIDWRNEQGKTVGKIGELAADIFSVILEIDAEGNIEGSIDFYAHLDQDQSLTSLAILRAGISGKFSYIFAKSGASFKSYFDFKGVENINLDLVKQSQVIASLKNGSLDENGILNGKIRLLQEIDYQTAQLLVRVKKLAFDISYGVGQDFLIESGMATLIISNINLIQGELKVLVDVEDNAVSAAVQDGTLSAFGMVLTNLNLKIDLDENLNFTALNGSLSATHDDFGIALDVGEIMIENGKMVVFNLSGEVSYKDLQVIIQQSNFESSSNSILLSAYVEVENGDIKIAADIEDFSINQNGDISWGGYNVNFDGVKSFGPLKVAISAASSSGSGTYKTTTAKASLSLSLDEDGDDEVTITDATITYLKHKNKERYKDIKIVIDGASINTPAIGPLKSQLQVLNIEIDTEENYLTGSEESGTNALISKSSYLKFKINTDTDLQFGGMLILASGVSGSVLYNFSGDGLKGSFDFKEVQNLNIIAKKGESILAMMQDATIPENGILAGTLTALPAASFISGGFNVQVEELIFDIVIPFQQDISYAEITAGSGFLNINSIGNLEGSLGLKLNINEFGNISAEVASSSQISAFGMTLLDFDLKTELKPNLEIKTIQGQLNANHPQFDAHLLVSDFLVENGELQAFNIEGKVSYEGFNLELEKAEYTENSLVVDGKVAINVAESAAWLSVEELTIAADGTVTINGIEGELDKSPVYIAFSASMNESRFTGSFTGELSGIGLEGKIDIGVENQQYNFAYLQLTAKANIPLAGSGLKLTQLGGQFGYNYALTYNQANAQPQGSPQEGNYVVGLTIGVADMADMVEVSGTSVIQFGNDKFDLNLTGEINIPKENTIATGKANIHYVLPDNTLDGSLSIDVSVPSRSGKLLEGKFAMEYAMGNSEWSVTSTDISAKLFTEVDFVGNIALTGSGDGNSFSGVLSGASSYNFSYNKTFEAFGADLIASLDAGFNFTGTIIFDDTGAEGDVSLYLYANGELGIETMIGGYKKLIGLNGSSLAQLSFDRDSALLAGQMDVTVYFLGFERKVDVDIEQKI
jgi:fibronectin type III domain protein